MAELSVLINGLRMGRIVQGKAGRLSMIYEDEWRQAQGAYPLSLSMPLAGTEHGPAVTEPFLWGLLPDNDAVLERWAKKFHVSARSVFGLISAVGEDCAGAAQFLSADKIKGFLKGVEDKAEWLTERSLAERLRTLRQDHAAWRLPRDTGQFSLAGAQPKTALLYQKGRWAIPHGRLPTTHILKPPTGEFDGHAENEHLCLQLARAVGLSTVSTQVMHFEDEVAIVVDRYDRIQAAHSIIRVHQEDTCQALGLPPSRKYQNERGPAPEQLVDLIRAQSSDAQADIDAFTGALAFNWLIAGTDAHAKNYSLLIADGPNVRLAPLYDIASALPYPRLDRKKLKLAMKIGGEYLVEAIGIRNWHRSAKAMKIDVDRFVVSMIEMAKQIPDEVESLRKKAKKDGLNHKIIDRLAGELTIRAKHCKRLLQLPAKI